MSDAPTPAEIRHYLDTIAALDRFEAQHRYTRGWGAFDPADLPIPAVVKVSAWLEAQAAPAAVGGAGV